jgi:hypothetical protein
MYRTRSLWTNTAGKAYFSIWLREYCHKNGRIKIRNLLNFKNWPGETIDALEAGLNAHKNSSTSPKKIPIDTADNPSVKSAPLKAILQQISLEQGSGLSATRMVNLHAVASILQFEQSFSENNLYDKLKWLDQKQKYIANRLSAYQCAQKAAASVLFLYDVASSYLEEEKNELTCFGCNRDKKRGQFQLSWDFCATTKEFLSPWKEVEQLKVRQ